MTYQRQYEAALSAFAKAGNRYALIPELTAKGKAAGLTADDIIADARQNGVCNRDADIRRMFNGSTVTASKRRRGYLPMKRMKPRKPELKTYPDEVRNRIKWGEFISSSGELMAASPVKVDDLKGIVAARVMLNAMFKPDDLILVGTMKEGLTDRNLRPVREWLTDPRLTDYEQVKINPFTGKEEDGGNKGKTCIGEKCIARYPLMLMEFDGLPFEDQCRFWAGMLECHMPVVAIVYSGGKSLHGLLRVGAANERIWWDRCNQAKVLYCADPDERYRADVQAMRPAVAVRLAGAVRRDTKREQRLLYLDPDAGRAKTAQDAQKRGCRRGDGKTDKDLPGTPEAIAGRFGAVSTLPFRCADCKTVADCKIAFGKYWLERSQGGIGCNHPFAYSDAELKACKDAVTNL